jgi:hypothetical protein
MVVLHGIVLFDLAAIIAMLVIASLSKSIGEALKIAPYYKWLYVTAVFIGIAIIADTVPAGMNAVAKTITLGFRCAAGLIALPVCLRYWKWLIAEYFKT